MLTQLAAVAAIVSVGIQFVLFLRWLHRRMRADEVARTFVRDLALNHLPHIYQTLRRIADYHGVPIEEPPLVEFVDFSHKANGKYRGKVR